MSLLISVTVNSVRKNTRVKKSAKLRQRQKILGHTQIKTTQRYAHLANDTLLDAANQVSKLVPLSAVMPKSVNVVTLVQVSSA